MGVDIISKYDMVREYATDFLDGRGVGYHCLICERDIFCRGGAGWRGLGFMNIAMQSHMDKHFRNGEIPDISKVTRHIMD